MRSAKCKLQNGMKTVCHIWISFCTLHFALYILHYFGLVLIPARGGAHAVNRWWSPSLRSGKSLQTHRRAPLRAPAGWKLQEPYRAVEELLFAAHRGRFDAAAVRTLLRVVALYPIGSCVWLNDGRVGRVLRSNPRAVDRPMIVAMNLDRDPPELETVDLSTRLELSVVRIGITDRGGPPRPADPSRSCAWGQSSAARRLLRRMCKNR